MSVAATASWVLVWVLGDSWFGSSTNVGIFVNAIAAVVLIVVAAVLWNLDDLRRAWAHDRAAKRR